MCYTDSTYAERFPERGKMNGDTVCYSEDGYDFDSADNLTCEFQDLRSKQSLVLCSHQSAVWVCVKRENALYVCSPQGVSSTHLVQSITIGMYVCLEFVT